MAFVHQAEETTYDWLTVIALPMESQSQDSLTRRIVNPEDRLSGVGLMVLIHRLSIAALGIPLAAAATLSGMALWNWWKISAWATTKGSAMDRHSVENILRHTYAMQLASCSDEKELATLNRKIFGSSEGW